MENAQVQTVHEILQSIQENRRLLTVIASMSQELARLDEDNLQLRAAVGMYREVARRHQETVNRMRQPANQRIHVLSAS